MKMRADHLDLSKIFNKIEDLQDKDPELSKMKSQADGFELLRLASIKTKGWIKAQRKVEWWG